MSPDSVMAELKARGLIVPIAKAAGINRQAVRQWRMVPPHRVLLVEQISGIDRTKIRPDLYPPGERRRRRNGRIQRS